jgi:DNA-binding Xre family transcriptional regulator
MGLTASCRRLLIALDEVCAGSWLSKAELACRIGVKPSVVSRLLDGKGRNVQLDTIADVADALDVYIEMRVRPQPKRKQARHAPIEVLAASALRADAGPLPSDFDQLIADIEREAHEEGPEAVRELEQFREEYGLAGARIGTAGSSPGSREAADAPGNNPGNKLSATQELPSAEAPANTGSVN